MDPDNILWDWENIIQNYFDGTEEDKVVDRSPGVMGGNWLERSSGGNLLVGQSALTPPACVKHI